MAIFQASRFRKGMTYALFAADLSDPGFKRSLDRLADTGCNWVALAIGWWQEKGDSVDIAPHPSKTPNDKALADLVDHIHGLGMQVFLKPFIDAHDHTWRAEFTPRNRGHWFRSYTTFINHYAHFAKEKELALFSVGCENVLGNAAQQAYWRDIIAGVRERYAGPLTYAANFDKSVSYRKVLFWDLLDFIGIDAYFSVADEAKSPVKHIRRKWEKRIRKIERWHNRSHPNIPVLFTELGVGSYQGAATQPWAYPDDVIPDLQEQADYYQAFFDAFADRNWLKGVFWWWWDNPSTGDYIENKAHPQSQYAYFYTPQGKPAEIVLRDYFT